MKPLWVQTLAWVAAIAAALLLALSGPEGSWTSRMLDAPLFPQGATAPR
jgi:hypothetical protein